jgi:hypothetical protein
MDKTQYKNMHHRYRYSLRKAICADDAGDAELCEEFKSEFETLQKRWPLCVLLRVAEPVMPLKMRADYHAQIPF